MHTPAFLVVLGTILSLFAFCSGKPSVIPDNKQASVGLYIETLCPYCAHFTRDIVKDLLDEGILELADVTIVPSGNVHTASGDKIECQHGEDECRLNRMLSCVIHLYPEQDTFLKYATCSEGLPTQQTSERASQCLKDMGISVQDISACADGELGKELDVKAMQATQALQPAHEYVPWVVVNGEPLYDDYANLGRYICSAYTGPRPKACFKEEHSGGVDLVPLQHADKTGTAHPAHAVLAGLDQ